MVNPWKRLPVSPRIAQNLQSVVCGGLDETVGGLSKQLATPTDLILPCTNNTRVCCVLD